MAEVKAQRASRSGGGGVVALTVLAGLLAVRCLNAVAVETFFQPDEYYQSLEPAWHLAFGPSTGAWITWEWRERLRSAMHPVAMAIVYKVAAYFSTVLSLGNVSRANLLVAAPKAFQAVVATAIDFYTWKLALIAYGRGSRESIAVLMLTVCNPWQWFFAVRTFSNTLETLLTTIALSQLPWQWLLQQDRTAFKATRAGGAPIDLRKILEGGGDFQASISSTTPKQTPSQKQDFKESTPTNSMGSLSLALAAAGLACALRPTNAIVWVSILTTALYYYGSFEKGIAVIKTGMLVSVSILALSVLVDRAYYGMWTLTQLQFLYFNIAQNVSVFYGRNRPDYYFTEGLPLLLTTIIPFAALGFWQSIRPGPDRPGLAGYYERQMRYLLAVVVASTVLVFSMIAHKEVRFIYPLLPMLHVLAARPVVSFFKGFPIPKSTAKLCLLLLGIALSTYIQSYVGFIHQRGVLDVIQYLRHEAEVGGSIKEISVGFLMPCHSTPWRSHLVHPEIKAWALTCEPPLHMTPAQRSIYEDEADNFYNHPGGWLSLNMEDRDKILRSKPYNGTASDPRLRSWPDYLVFFEQLEPTMNGALDRTRYTECWRTFNTHWHDDWRRRGDVVVHCLDKS